MKQYIEQNKERFYEELFSLLRIPSISRTARRSAQRRMSSLCSALAIIEGMRRSEKSSS